MLTRGVARQQAHTVPTLSSSPAPACAVRFRKVLYERQPFPDDHTDESFLSELVLNLNVRRRSYWVLVHGSVAVTQQLSVVAVTALVFAAVRSGGLTPSHLLRLDGTRARVASTPERALPSLTRSPAPQLRCCCWASACAACCVARVARCRRRARQPCSLQVSTSCRRCCRRSRAPCRATASPPWWSPHCWRTCTCMTTTLGETWLTLSRGASLSLLRSSQACCWQAAWTAHKRCLRSSAARCKRLWRGPSCGETSWEPRPRRRPLGAGPARGN